MDPLDRYRTCIQIILFISTSCIFVLEARPKKRLAALTSESVSSIPLTNKNV